MKKNEILNILKECNSIENGHFLLSSGKHSDTYIQCAKLTMFPNYANLIANEIKEKCKNLNIDVVVGPAMGGIIISYELARVLNKPAMFTERVDNVMTLRRGFKIEKNQNVLICEDVVTTAKSSMETIEVLKKMGANIVGIASIIDRTSENINLEYNIYSAIKLEVATYEKTECKLCIENKINLIKPGSRKFD